MSEEANIEPAVETLDTSVLAVAEEEAPAEEVRPLAEPAKPDAGGFVWGTGRRKSAVARVRVKPGSGVFLIKGKEVKDFFSEPQHQAQCLAPLKATETEGKLDIYVNTHGGGITGQAGAIMLGLARALKGYDPTLEQALRDEHFLTRDPREVERKKYGQRGARRKFQFSKR
ncbi:MAG: 30S ribosomal protein S9 [Phycisphaerales bacterium JB063]